MADWPDSSPSIDGITNATSPSDATVGGPAKITELAGEVTAIGGDLFTAKATNGGYATFTALVSALWSAISGKASSSHDHDGTYSAAAHNHSGTYDPAGSAASAQAAAVQRANHTGTQLASTISDFNAAVRTNRLDQLATPTASVAMGSQKITGLGTPTASTDAVTKAYADALTGATLPDGPFVYATDYGVRMNGAMAMVKTTSGSSTILSQGVAQGYYGADFKAEHVGATIRLNTGTFSEAVVTRTIASVSGDGTSITVSGGTIPFTSNLVVAEWSHDTDAQITANTAAMQTCIDEAQGRTILFPPGTAIFDSGFDLREGSRFKGAGVAHRMKSPPTEAGLGSYITNLVLKRGVNETFFYAGVTCNAVEFRDIQTWGTTNPETTECNTIIQGPVDGFQVNTLFDNARMYGGDRVLRCYYTSIGMVRGGIFGNGRRGGVHLISSPDWCFLGADVHQYTNWNHITPAPGATGTAYEFDQWSGGQTVIGGFAEFGQFGFAIASSENTIMGCRISDARDSSIAIIGNNNTITGNTFIGIPGAWGGWTTGARCAIWCGGSYNTISSNSMYDHNGQMQYSVVIDQSYATYNKVILGAARYPHYSTGAGVGNVFI